MQNLTNAAGIIQQIAGLIQGLGNGGGQNNNGGNDDNADSQPAWNDNAGDNNSSGDADNEQQEEQDNEQNIVPDFGQNSRSISLESRGKGLRPAENLPADAAQTSPAKRKDATGNLTERTSAPAPKKCPFCK